MPCYNHCVDKIRHDRSEVVFSRGDAENAEDSYSYDNIGNLVNHVSNGATNSYTANSLNQYTLRASAPPREFTYDSDGNMLSDGVFTYAYDAVNRLSSVTSNGVALAAYSYDAQGRRVKKIAADGTHLYFYDGWLLIREHLTRPDNTVSETQYCWGTDMSGTLQGAGSVGGLLYLTVSNFNSNSQLQLYVPFYDNNGNITRYCDVQGNVVTSYTYDAFGNTIAQSGPMANNFALRFSTKYFDCEANLYYYGYRYYCPKLMRWQNKDPIGERGGRNLYAFCGNNAVNCCDYLGFARLLSGALLARNGKGYHNGEASARKVIRLIDWLNRKTDTKGRKCFNASIRDLVLTPLSEVKSLIDKHPDDVYITAHGGLNVNGQIWRGSSYNWKKGDSVIEGFDIRHDGVLTPLSSFGPNLRSGNIYGCYISPRVRKIKQPGFLGLPWGGDIVSEKDDYDMSFLALYENLKAKYAAINECPCAKTIIVFEGERGNRTNTNTEDALKENYPPREESFYSAYSIDEAEDGN